VPKYRFEIEVGFAQCRSHSRLDVVAKHKTLPRAIAFFSSWPTQLLSGFYKPMPLNQLSRGRSFTTVKASDRFLTDPTRRRPLWVSI
jgi:hypothetical protein